jgi:hypothetical protein
VRRPGRPIGGIEIGFDQNIFIPDRIDTQRFYRLRNPGLPIFSLYECHATHLICHHLISMQTE